MKTAVEEYQTEGDTDTCPGYLESKTPVYVNADFA